MAILRCLCGPAEALSRETSPGRLRPPTSAANNQANARNIPSSRLNSAAAAKPGKAAGPWASQDDSVRKGAASTAATPRGPRPGASRQRSGNLSRAATAATDSSITTKNCSYKYRGSADQQVDGDGLPSPPQQQPADGFTADFDPLPAVQGAASAAKSLSDVQEEYDTDDVGGDITDDATSDYDNIGNDDEANDEDDVSPGSKRTASTWSVKVMAQLQLMPDRNGRMRLPSILMFTQRRPPRETRTQAWWTKLRGVLVEVGQGLGGGGGAVGSRTTSTTGTAATGSRLWTRPGAIGTSRLGPGRPAAAAGAQGDVSRSESLSPGSPGAGYEFAGYLEGGYDGAGVLPGGLPDQTVEGAAPRQPRVTHGGSPPVVTSGPARGVTGYPPQSGASTACVGAGGVTAAVTLAPGGASSGAWKRAAGSAAPQYSTAGGDAGSAMTGRRSGSIRRGADECEPASRGERSSRGKLAAGPVQSDPLQQHMPGPLLLLPLDAAQQAEATRRPSDVLSCATGSAELTSLSGAAPPPPTGPPLQRPARHLPPITPPSPRLTAGGDSPFLSRTPTEDLTCCNAVGDILPARPASPPPGAFRRSNPGGGSGGGSVYNSGSLYSPGLGDTTAPPACRSSNPGGTLLVPAIPSPRTAAAAASTAPVSVQKADSCSRTATTTTDPAGHPTSGGPVVEEAEWSKAFRYLPGSVDRNSLPY